MNEESAIIVGHRRGRVWYGRLRERRVGLPAEVTFAWDWALEREERYGDVIGFFHTHPDGFPTPSERDVRTLQGWVNCFGKPLLCVIASGDVLTAYLFSDDADPGCPLEVVAKFPRGILVAAAIPA